MRSAAIWAKSSLRRKRGRGYSLWPEWGFPIRSPLWTMASVHSRLTVLASILAIALAPAFFAKRPMQAQLSNQESFVCSSCVEREGRFYCGTCEQAPQREGDPDILQHDEWVEEVVCNPADQARCAEQGKYCQVIFNRKECIWGRGDAEPQDTPTDTTQPQDEGESERVREARSYCEEMGLRFELVDNIPFCTGEPSADGAGGGGSPDGSAGIWNPNGACTSLENERCLAQGMSCTKMEGQVRCMKSQCSLQMMRECAITNRECVVTAGGEVCQDNFRANTAGGTTPVDSCTSEMIARCRGIAPGWDCIQEGDRPRCAQVNREPEGGSVGGIGSQDGNDDIRGQLGGDHGGVLSQPIVPDIAPPLPPEPEPEPIPTPEPVVEDPLTRSIWTFFCGLSGRSYDGTSGCQ